MAQTTTAASETTETVLQYLTRVVDATSILCLAENQEPTTVQPQQNGEALTCQVAENLLKASDPNLLLTALPKPLQELEQRKANAKEQVYLVPKVDDSKRIPDWKVNRSDYLRRALRGLPPIALDVAAQIVSMLISKTNDNDQAPMSLAASTFVLFSKWLPIAPQLAPLVSDLFALDAFPCPLDFGDHPQIHLLVAEAAHAVYEFYAKRGEHASMKVWWPWEHLLSMVANYNINEEEDVVMTDASYEFDYQQAIRWHAARAIGFLLDLRPAPFAAYLDRLNARQERVAWVPHPWMVDHEEERAQFRALNGRVSFFDDAQQEFPAVYAQDIRRVVPLHSLLVHVGDGVVLVKNDAIHQLASTRDNTNAMEEDRPPRRKSLIMTPTTSENMALLGAAMCCDPYPMPILLCGPPGSGKSSLVRELAHYCYGSQDDLLELHVDEETDSKTLIGSYTTTDIPGEFTWRPGALTQAVRSGKWVLMEDVDTVPMEIQAAIVQLLEERMLPLGGGKFERCHSSFRLFGTCATTLDNRIGETSEPKSLRLTGKKLLNPSLWQKVHVQPLAFSELKQVAESLFPLLPSVVAEAALNIFKVLDASGRSDVSEHNVTDLSNETTRSVPYRLSNGRHASVRDFLKLLSRISSTVMFEQNVEYVTEAQRTLCLAETVDVFAASCPSFETKKDFVVQVAAPCWEITGELALNYMQAREPSVARGSNYTEIGRAKIPNTSTLGRSIEHTNEKFAPTNFSLRLMESIGVCISENEPTLLVGETGCGKTTLLQQLARYAGRELIVQNLSLQTDSTDLLGGYRPLEIPHIARNVYLEFVDIFVATFSRKQNADFLKFASSMHEKRQWKKLAQCFMRAAALGLGKVKERMNSSNVDPTVPGLDSWRRFSQRAQQFENQRLACDSGLAFAFTEGALVDAIRSGKWVLLDEINLASSETLQRLCGLLDDSTGSVTLTERGDSQALKRHPEFRLFAAMNPATDAGKKDLPPSIRARFTELYVDELLDAVELRTVAAQYLRDVVSANDAPLECTETVGRAVDIYLQCRDLADQQLVDAAGHKPRYTMRTMCRALSAARNLVSQQKLSLARSMLEGFELAFEGALDSSSTKAVQKVLRSHLGTKLSRSEMDHPPRRPSGASDERYVLVKPFWLKAGPLEQTDWSEGTEPGRSRFILTETMSHNLRRLSRAVSAGPWPILLEGPTSAGKTTLIEYLAARCGHEIVRINNHEHTDVQEYTGGYSSDANGSLSFHDGLLVRALRRGHWVILDELNLAPSEVLEALNRLLDDNRELYLPETNETVKPHPNFRLFATQNPSGAYGGRKPLSRAFRNRFVELHMGDIPSEEMRIILEKRCLCPPSHAKALVKIMVALRQRRNAHGVFLGKDGLITPRDLLRWAERGGSSKLVLAQEGYMLLAERLRSDDEKAIVKEEIESQLKVTVDCDELYYGDNSEARKILARSQEQNTINSPLSSIAPTRSLLRLLTLVERCVRQKEPVLLVGETGCGKTTVVQLLSEILNRNLHVVNCHATTETSDLIGGLRPVRGRGAIMIAMQSKVNEFLSLFPDREALEWVELSVLLNSVNSNVENEANQQGVDSLSDESLSRILSLVETLYDTVLAANESPELVSDEIFVKEAKKRKLASGASMGVYENANLDTERVPKLKEVVDDIKLLVRRWRCLFEWADGPLVHAMHSGHLLLLDEMSLAEDAVLERLNSVLEPSRTIVLAEKGTDAMDERDSNTVIGHKDFRIFATMNPGGDFGKRELSPALRSRFTEIWVPQVTDPVDIELVLGYTLASASGNCDWQILREKILNYVNFFNISVCGDPSSPCADLTLSLRDVLAWARFVVDVSNSNDGMDMWVMYCHGACLMHLDGLGLGTGLSLEDAANAKRKAISFLMDQVPFESRPECMSSFKADFSRRLVAEEKRFGVHPFTIEHGAYPVPKSSFDFEAPTPSLNLLRLLRAMQISKPILLEGSPGVGKTSLATALAAASGHRLVRINLSEQTDMSDLMGSDLPDPEQVGEGDESGTPRSGSSFRWCDGVLLRAIKQGDWVLLDELNLASQSVLEGLNSCLDHRASVFIPELGKTFHCPPTFRIFAAQNPLAQGGGRKGLPKSFLNRFSKVYVESLTEEDLHSIVSSRFPAVPAKTAKSMIMFNKKVHEEVVDRHEYGVGGSPWEFNLRDVFRWCELVDANDGASDDELARFARHLYLQRFRTTEDRQRLDLSYRNYFGTSLLGLPSPKLSVTDQRLIIGNVGINRRLLSVDTAMGQLLGMNPVVTRSLYDSLEAVATCVSMKWPCLLVGSSGSGKSSLLSSLAELCNAPLINVALTSATDVNELVGSFEQVDSDEERTEIIRCFRLLRDDACAFLSGSREERELQQKLLQLCRSIHRAATKELIAIGFEVIPLLKTASKLSESFSQFSQLHLERVQAALEGLERSLGGKVERDKSHFRWVDGVLVTAMIHGYWLHLENVNLCPASVLDRLNSVMEKNGELLLTECGVQADSEISGTNHQVVKQHPDFRIILSMDPENGEISRAMRNRCVEIALLSRSTEAMTRDCNDLIYSTGIRSMPLANSMVAMHTREIAHASGHGVEPPSTKHLRQWGVLMQGLGSRGLRSSIETSCRLSYEFNTNYPMVSLETRPDANSLFQMPSVRWGWSFCPHQAHLDLQLRIVKLYNEGATKPVRLAIDATKPVRLAIDTPKPTVAYEELNAGRMQLHFISLYLGRSTLLDLVSRSRTLDGYSDASSDFLRFMAWLLEKTVVMLRLPTNDSVARSTLDNDALLAVQLRRLAHLLHEQDTSERVKSVPKSVASQSMSAMETSFGLSEGRIDRSLVSCPVTPMLFPFFRAVDDWVQQLMASPERVEFCRLHASELETFLIRRDQLWLCLHQSIYNGISTANFLGFDESGFVVQWIWLKKRLALVALPHLSFACGQEDPMLTKLKRHVDAIVERIDRVLFGTGDGLSRTDNALWKKGGHPLVPRRAAQWQSLDLLNQTSSECALLHEASISETSFSRIELNRLIENSSPIMFMDGKKRGEQLAALCTCFWASTDEVEEGQYSRPMHDSQQLGTAVCQELRQRREMFATQVRASKVDTEIKTVENMLDMDALSTLRETSGHYGTDEDFLQQILVRFAQIQASPIAEFWCVREEKALVGALAETLISCPDADMMIKSLKELVPRLRTLIDVVLSHTCIAVVDIRPYQTLLWFIMGQSGETSKSIKHLLQCLLPRMMNALSRHTWCNSFNDLEVIADRLELPLLSNYDGNGGPEEGTTRVRDCGVNDLRRGPPGLHSSVKSEVVFRFVGPTISSRFHIARRSNYSTIENHDARKKQAQSIVCMFSTLKHTSSEGSDMSHVLYLFVAIVEALIDFFPDKTGDEILVILRDTETLRFVDKDYCCGLLSGCEHPVFRECLESAVFPLLTSIQSTLSGIMVSENLALCWIYIGLLQMSLLVPRSPLDPGTKPKAKVVEHDRYLEALEERIAAMDLDGILVDGRSPNGPAYHSLVAETKCIQEKRERQERKRIERVSSAPPFIDFFRESRRFLQSMTMPEGIPTLVRVISEAPGDDDNVTAARVREYNWQVTSSSFCSRVSSHFAAYEDIALPFVNAIENVRNGIRLLAERHLFPRDAGASSRSHAFDSLLAFPGGDLFSSHEAEELLPMILSIPERQRSRVLLKRCRFAISLSVLYRIDVQARLHGGDLSNVAILKSHSVFSSVAKAWSIERDGPRNESIENAEDLLEKEYREQFPDHGKEFRSLLQTIDMGEEFDQEVAEETVDVLEENWQLADDQIAILCSLHRDLYLPSDRTVDDSRRTRAMSAAYTAAFHISQASLMPTRESAHGVEQLGAHIMALGMASSNVGTVHGSTTIDFHRDPNPKEVTRASRPLKALILRASQLLNAFPGHSVLVALIRVADHCRKLPLSSTSVGKAMHGLEIILRKAQDWEQHASSLVKLGTSLRDVSELVASWRKLELQSWGTLLESRESRFVQRAQRHWPRLYGVLINATGTEDCNVIDGHIDLCTVGAPTWVWKGLQSDATSTFSVSNVSYDEVDASLFDLSRVMDTFLLSSSLGEFKERLSMVKAFANQLLFMCFRSGKADPSRAKVGRMLSSLVSFYKQFVPFLESRLSDLRRPIEARLKNEVKLAKWDEQSYYALKESTEKNHLKLMKLLREYDDVLELSVSLLLEKHLCHGVRATESAVEECSSSIPPYQMLFPFVAGEASPNDVSPKSQLSLTIEADSWGDAERSSIACDKYITRMRHYARRMTSLLEAQRSNGVLWSRAGASNASTLSETIFERIESLRKEGTTKTMKQRALVDLFKSLKENGFRQTKWSVPEHVREMAHLLQLPGLADSGSLLSSPELEELEGAESYFQRTMAEVSRLRSEVQMLGSKHMSQREMQIMLSFSEHGLSLMCQQRCILARLLQQVSRLEHLTEGCRAWNSLPVGQKSLLSLLSDFYKSFLSATENLKQLQLLLKTSLSLVEGPDKAESIRDTVAIVNSCILSLEGVSMPYMAPVVVTSSFISDAAAAGSALEETRRLIRQCQETCEKRQSLPPEVFNPCLEELERSNKISLGLPSSQEPDGVEYCSKDISSVMDGISAVVQKVLLSVQALCKDSINTQGPNANKVPSEESIFDCHSASIKELAAIDLDSITEASSRAIEMVLSVLESNAVPKTQRDCCTAVVSDATKLVRNLLQISREKFVDYIKFSRSFAKLNYILARVFRVLVSKGYCADSIANDGDGEGDISGMNFDDDNDGTGMGEGDGKQDVTDQLESEEQLLGLKDDKPDDAPTEQQQSRELNEEEAKQGMEMEGDFEGDMFDVPEPSRDDEQDNNGDDEEELDREMGDGPDKNEDIIDEKLWDQSDDEGEQDRSDEKFEKDSGVQGESIEDEMRTRQDDETRKGEDATTEDSTDPKPSGNDDGGVDEEMKDEQEINEDSEEKYEEKAAGVNVRDEENGPENIDDGDDEATELDDNMNLDNGSDGGEPEEGGDAMDTEIAPPEIPDEDGVDNVESTHIAEDGNESDSQSSQIDEEILETTGLASERNEDGDEPEGDRTGEEDVEMPDIEFSGNASAEQDVQGIQSKDGKDNITDTKDEENEGDGNDGRDGNDDGLADEPPPQASAGGTSGDGGDSGAQGDSAHEDKTDKQQQDTVSAPNPFQNPGDATKFWHKKLRMLDTSAEGGDDEMEANDHENVGENGDGEFEFAPKDQSSSTQVLGEADEEQAGQMKDQAEPLSDESADLAEDDAKPQGEKDSSLRESQQKAKNSGRKSGSEQQKTIEEVSESEADADDVMNDQDSVVEDATDGNGEDASRDEVGNRVVTDLSQLKVNDESLAKDQFASSLMEEEEHFSEILDADVAAARSQWSEIQGETHHLARRLCEKLRLVMEPLVATKLKGDYRTGKRINMKRVIGYIASGYRKDKIWLRRTKPAKRNYRVLLAVDNSESMNKSGAGSMALAAMATLAVGMSQLEIGELGVASFGEEMRLLHPFHQPFTSESGVNVVRNFPFNEERTRTALCVESAIAALDSQGDAASMQLVFLISDGRIERDSRDSLRRLVREMVERNILLVMIIVEGDKNGPTKKKDSIVHMKEVSFKNGKPNVKQFIEDYPFPYYMVLEDMQSLPELLGGALSQWFEMIAQIQGTSG